MWSTSQIQTTSRNAVSFVLTVPHFKQCLEIMDSISFGLKRKRTIQVTRTKVKSQCLWCTGVCLLLYNDDVAVVVQSKIAPLLDWPTCSPDLSLADNVWRMNKHKHKTQIKVMSTFISSISISKFQQLASCQTLPEWGGKEMMMGQTLLSWNWCKCSAGIKFRMLPYLEKKPQYFPNSTRTCRKWAVF